MKHNGGFLPGSWGKTRKMLEEDFLCDTLKGRVTYFVTRYRHAHDERGRACVRVDGKEVINMSFVVEGEKSVEAYRRRAKGDTRSLHDIYEDVDSDFTWSGRFEGNDFGFALNEYFGASIASALQSKDPLVRMLAVLDRRVGKRTLQTLRQKAGGEPEWLRFFYHLRLEAEGMAQQEQKS